MLTRPRLPEDGAGTPARSDGCGPTMVGTGRSGNQPANAQELAQHGYALGAVTAMTSAKGGRNWPLKSEHI